MIRPWSVVVAIVVLVALAAGLVLLVGRPGPVTAPMKQGGGSGRVVGGAAAQPSGGDATTVGGRAPAADAAGRSAARSLVVSIRAATDRAERPLVDSDVTVTLRRGERSRSARLRTDSEGRARLVGLEIGRQEVEVEASGHVPGGAEIDVATSDHAVEVEVLLEEGVRLWGLVQDESGAPAPGARLEWSTPQSDDVVEETTADSNGRYETSSLRPGRWRARVLPGELSSLWRDAPRRLVTLRDRGGGTRIDLTADLGQRLRVRVTDERGKPLAGAAPSFLVETASAGARGVLTPTDASGRTALGGLPSRGRLELEASFDGTFDEWAGGLEELPDEIVLRLSRP